MQFIAFQIMDQLSVVNTQYSSQQIQMFLELVMSVYTVTKLIQMPLSIKVLATAHL